MQETLGLFIARRREQLGMTQRALAMKAGFSNNYLSELEMGAKKQPGPDILRALSGPLEVPYLELLWRAGILTDEEYRQLPSDIDPELVDFFREMKHPDNEMKVFMREGAKASPKARRIALAAIKAFLDENGFEHTADQEEKKD